MSNIAKKIKWKFLYLDENKILIFVNLVFTSIFIQLVVSNKLLFSLIYYPILYIFSCHWATKDKINLVDFIFQFFVLNAAFIVIFLFLQL